MKMGAPVFLAFVALTTLAFGQAFQNLGFDDANTSNIVLAPGPDGPMGSGPISDLLPGWQIEKGANPVTTLDLNITPLAEGNYLSLVGTSTAFGRYIDGVYGLAQSDTSNVQRANHVDTER